MAPISIDLSKDDDNQSYSFDKDSSGVPDSPSEYPLTSEGSPFKRIKLSELNPQSNPRSLVLSKLNGRILSPLIHLDQQKSQLTQLLQHTIVQGEGNSCLIMGPRATGKTTLVETVLKELRDQHPTKFLAVRLSGFAQTDDNMALREITRQLDLQLSKNKQHYAYLEKKSISETVQSLLAVFHPDDEDDEDDESVDPKPHPTALSIVFVLEEFDRFAQHSRQTLLYNLFDIAQSSRAPIAVVGVTARMV